MLSLFENTFLPAYNPAIPISSRVPLPTGAPLVPTGALPPVVDGLEGGGGGCETALRLSNSRQVIKNRLYVFFILYVFWGKCGKGFRV